MIKKIIESSANILLLLLLLMAAVSYNGKLFGHKIEDIFSNTDTKVELLQPGEEQLRQLGLHRVKLQKVSSGVWSVVDSPEKEIVVHSQRYSKGIYGFSGPIPMYIHLDSDKRIQNILLMDNDETPEFLDNIKSKGIISQWIGKDYDSLSTFKPDALSGATLTSNAINQSLLNSIAGVNNASGAAVSTTIDIKSIIAVLVIIMAIITSFLSKKYKHLRLYQMIVNTIVLGFWCGKFISFKVLAGWVSNGINLVSGGVVLLMLILSIVLPLFFNKKTFYCMWVCPFGAAQELAGKITKRRVHLGKKTIKILNNSKEIITLIVFISMWLGLAPDILDYEPFTAFIFNNASVAVFIIAGLSLITAIFIPRPWCRFVCPAGQILKWIHK